MSESPLFMPPFVPVPGRVETPHPVNVTPSESELDPDDDPLPAAPVREGLPAHYRMRAEPHYVEALARPRADKPVDQPEAAPESRVKSPTDSTVGAASDALARALASINASLSEVRSQGRPLRERVLIELARAEAVRAGWLAEAVDVLQREPLPALDEVNLGAIVACVAEALAPEYRLTGHAPSITRSEVPVKVFGDERLLTVAVGGMLQGLCSVVEGRGELSRVGLRVTQLREGMTRGVEVWQTAVRMSAAVVGRLFDADWTEHPAGPSGAVFLAAARRIAALQGGMLDARLVDGGGCRLVLTLPAAE